jgi:hypothetical protein
VIDRPPRALGAPPAIRPSERLRVGAIALGALILVAGCLPTANGAVAAAVGTPAPRPGTPGPSPVDVATMTLRPTPTPSIAVATATPTTAPTASPSPSPTPSPSPSGPYAVNLYRKGDFVTQANKHQCVSAAMQVMLNVIGPTNDRRTSTQATLARLAKRLSNHHDGGTEPEGWARGLERRDAGDYAVVAETTIDKAVRRAIAAIRATGRPVGLLVWRGAHSWVLHGFETTADPATTDDYEVTGLWVSDPWYPRISSIWGASRKPNQRITVKQLREDYRKWRRPTGRYPGKDGKYVLVIPVA